MVLVDKIVANCLASNITAIEDYSLIFVAPATVIRTFLGVSTEQKSRKVEKEDCRVTEAYFGNPSSGVQRCVAEMTANYQLFSDMPIAKTEKETCGMLQPHSQVSRELPMKDGEHLVLPKSKRISQKSKQLSSGK